MKITYKGDYALKALLQLALRYGGDDPVMSITEIARFGDMPVKFLEQILLILRKGGYVKARRGVRGGFLLAKPPKEITVGEVIRFIEGPVEPISCADLKYSDCGDVSECVFRKIWQDVSRATADIIDNITFEKLVSDVGSRQRTSAYDI